MAITNLFSHPPLYIINLLLFFGGGGGWQVLEVCLRCNRATSLCDTYFKCAHP